MARVIRRPDDEADDTSVNGAVAFDETDDEDYVGGMAGTEGSDDDDGDAEEDEAEDD